MFFKTRMRRALRAILKDAAPQDMRPTPAALRREARAVETAARARGLDWHGCSAAQAAILLAEAARLEAGTGSVRGARLAAATAAFARRRALLAFGQDAAAAAARIEQAAALARQGHHPTHPQLHLASLNPRRAGGLIPAAARSDS